MKIIARARVEDYSLNQLSINLAKHRSKVETCSIYYYTAVIGIYASLGIYLTRFIACSNRRFREMPVVVAIRATGQCAEMHHSPLRHFYEIKSGNSCTTALQEVERPTHPTEGHGFTHSPTHFDAAGASSAFRPSAWKYIPTWYLSPDLSSRWLARTTTPSHAANALLFFFQGG